jgi:K+-transporting ATPase ATPase A chain
VTAHGITGITQKIAIGPVASQEAVKLLSGDGGGFFNTNSAHPFENPDGVSNLLEMLLMLAVPAAFTATFGAMTGRRRQGWTLYVVMLVMFVGGAVALSLAEAHGSPAQHLAGLHTAAQGNLEGKEVRFGASGSSLFLEAGTASGDGAVNSAVESFTGAGLAVAMANLMTGEVIFGGPGSGLYGMLALVVLAVFVAGLMVGRTPEYLGKQLLARQIKLATLATLFVPLLALIATALAITLHAGRASMSAHGPQGFAEAAYAYLSQAQNNGSALAGYSGFVQPVAGNVGSHGVVFADLLGGLVMTFGRFVPILLMLALAGSLAPARVAPEGLGTLRTDTPTFGLFTTGFIVVVAVLTFLTVLVIAPFADALSPHLLS